MEIKSFWVVRDPSLESEVEDIFFEATANRFAAYVIGSGLDQFRYENHSLYTEESEAKRDAEARLKKLHGERGAS